MNVFLAIRYGGVEMSYNLRGQSDSDQAIKLEADRNSFSFSAFSAFLAVEAEFGP